MMGIILVGQLNGRRQILWRNAIVLSCALGLFGAAVSATTYFALCGQFSLPAAMIGFVGPFLTVGTGIRLACRLPAEQLAPLDRPTV